ncbi:MAG: DNA translocase FtsK 4TM domain-containing protein, partial [Bacteroidetes bacterium]|nr:DNA translocase FtsK 4TM domain-containing protein [Bacteroidota bacterium]
MANKLKTKTPPAPNPEILNDDKEVDVTVEEVVKDERTKKILGAASLLTAVFIFLSIVSYLFSWQEDQDTVHNTGFKIFSSNAPKVHNMLGTIGAYIAHNLVFNGFGIVSIILSTFFFVLGINLLFAKQVFSLTKNLKYVGLSLIVISTTFAFATTGSQLSWGGAVGNFTNAWLSGILGKFGTAAILLLIYFSFFIWKFNPTFKLPNKKMLLPDVLDKTENIDVTKKSLQDEFEEFEQSKLLIDDDVKPNDSLNLGIIEKDENGMPISGNKLKAEVSPISNIDIVDEEH